MVQAPIQPDPIRPTVRSALSADLGAAKGIVDALRERKGAGVAPLASALGLYTVNAVIGTLLASLYGFNDWLMHLLFYICILSAGMLYARSHLRQMRVRRIFWTVFGASLSAFFAWALIDLVPARDVVDGPLKQVDMLTFPEVRTRSEAPWLYLPAFLNAAYSISLVLHSWLLRPKRLNTK